MTRPSAKICLLFRIAVLALAAMACEESIDQLAKRPVDAPVAAFDLRSASSTVAFRRHEIARRLRAEPVTPSRSSEAACPDDRLAGLDLDLAAKTLMLKTHDARIGAKHLLPLDLVRRIETDELDRIDRLFDQPPELGGKIRSEGIAKQALLAVEAASKRRFRGVYHILEFAPPALIHKLGKLRAEWVPGWLVARLAVEDLHEGRVICQTRVLVRNDVRDEPVFRRTKSQVKERLIAELGGTLRSDSARALAKITRVLRLPAD